MKNIEKKPVRILTLTILFTALGMFSIPKSILSFKSLQYGSSSLWAQDMNQGDHHEHINCSHSSSGAVAHTDKDHQGCDHLEHSDHQDNDHHEKSSHENCNHEEDIQGQHHDHPGEEKKSEIIDEDPPTCSHDHAAHASSSCNANGSEEHSGALVSMSAEDIRRFGIIAETVTSGDLDVAVKVRGEIILNRDRIAHVTPRVTGIVQKVYRSLGDFVEKGGIMAVIESRELADAKTDYLSNVKHLELSRTVFQREKKLRRKKVSSEQDYLAAKQSLAEAEIMLQSCSQRLKILGFGEAELKKLPGEPMAELSRFTVRSPFSGQVIKKEIVFGEVVTDAQEIFVVADLTTVWIDLDLYRNDVDSVKKGQKVIIAIPSQRESIVAEIDYVAPLVDEKTRTTMARIIVNNPGEKLRPGTYVTAEIITREVAAGVVVSRESLQEVGGHTCVFVQDEHGFESRPVSLGEYDSRKVEITSGLLPGETVVTKNGFRLKAALETGVGSGCGSPGHVH